MPNKFGLKCPDCGTTAIWKYGDIPMKTGLVKRYKCTVPGCARTFYRHTPGAIDHKSRKKK